MEMAVAMQTGDFPYLPSGLAEVNKMIKEHSDLFSDSQCKVCSAVLISESQKLTHYQSKKHANKVRRYLSIRNEAEPQQKKLKPSTPADCKNGESDRLRGCHICNMTFTCPIVAQSHYQGKVHAKNLRMKSIDFKIPVASSKPSAPKALPKNMPAKNCDSMMEMGGGDGTNSDRFCSICQASFNNPLMAQQHYVGKRHRKQITKQKLMETYGPSSSPASTLKGYQCTVCKIELNSVEQYQSHISGAKHKNQVKKSSLNLDESQEATEEPGNDFPAEDSQDNSADDNNQYMSEDTEYLEEYQYT